MKRSKNDILRYHGRPRLFLVTVVFASIFFMPSGTNAQYGHKDSSFVVRLGGLFVDEPEPDSYFSFGTQGEYRFAGPLWFNYGGLFGINGDFLIRDRMTHISQSALTPV